MTKDEMNRQLLQQVNSLTSIVDSLNAAINAQAQLIAQLNQTIQELKEQLNKNSQNSSRPPSSDGFKKPAPKSLRRPSGKKAGGQRGHQGTHLAVITAPNEIVKHMPSSCEGCPHYQLCKGTACIAEKRHVIDAAVTVNVTKHQALELPICMLHGDTRRGSFPSNVKAAVQYGKNLQALAVALNTVGTVSVKRTHEILSEVFNIPIAARTISNMVKRCADSLSGTAGMDQCGVLPKFKGTAMHDCWASYWNYPNIPHAVCCAHLLRELTGIDENHPEQKWASAFIDLLLEMKKVKEKAIEKGKDSLSYYHYHKFDKKYDELIGQTWKENPLPETTKKKRGRKKKGEIPALVERLANYKASVCLFIHNFMVPFDNNQAERDLRMIKFKTKVFGCFRTEKDARDYLKIMSYVGTAHKQGYNAYTAIRNAILGHPDFIFELRGF